MMVLTRNVFMVSVGVLCALPLMHNAFAENMRPIIIIQAPQVSGTDFIASHSDKALPQKKAVAPAAPMPANTPPAEPVAAQPPAVAPASDIAKKDVAPVPMPEPEVATKEAAPLEEAPEIAEAPPASEPSAPEPKVAATKPVEPPAKATTAKQVETVRQNEAPIPATVMEPAENMPARLAANPAKLPYTKGKPMVVQQPADISGALFIASHAPADVAKPVSNLKLEFLGRNNVRLNKVAIELVSEDGKPVFTTLACNTNYTTHVPPGTYHLNSAMDNFVVTQNITVTDDALKTYTVRFPTLGRADSGPPKPHAPTPTPVNVLLDSLHLLAHERELRCS